VYMTLVAPSLVDSLEGVEVPFPAATAFLAEACRWCGKNPYTAALIALGAVAGGVLPLIPSRHYYIALTVVASLALGFTYYSISAPVDRLMKQVKDNLPEERKIPDFLPGSKDGQRH